MKSYSIFQSILRAAIVLGVAQFLAGTFAAELFAQTTRTPGFRQTVVLEPYVWDLGNHSNPILTASSHHSYVVRSHMETSDPGTTPSVTLNDFISEMNVGNIGLLMIHTHGNASLIMIESYALTPAGLAARNTAFQAYLNNGVNSAWILQAQSSHSYGIALTALGIQNYANLAGALVYDKGCNTSGLNNAWGALASLGYNATISGLSGVNTFFERMDGTRDRGSGNTLRTTGSADDGIAHLVLTGNNDVVLSPVVLDHYPEAFEQVNPGDNGFVEFDCEMDQTIAANQIVTAAGAIDHLNSVHWANNHRIEFTIPDFDAMSTIEFTIHADLARSFHNHALLDGNTNPNETDGVGPNGDFYRWVSLTSFIGAMDFENGVDGAPIQSSIPGMEFITTEGYDWIYGDKRTGGYNIYPYNDATYWCDGNFFAWLGPNQGQGLINFTGATATSVSLGTSTYSGVYLDAYDVNGDLVSSDYAGNNLNTNTLTTLTVTGARIDHVRVHDTGNYWLIDNLVVRDLLQETLSQLPDDWAASFYNLYELSPGSVENVLVWVENVHAGVNFIINWMGGGAFRTPVELAVRIYDPNNNLYSQFNVTNAPFNVIVADPLAGQWRVEVEGIQVPAENFSFAFIAATQNEPTADVSIGALDIGFTPTVPHLGEIVEISAEIRCLAAAQPLSPVTVRCFAGDPNAGGIQVDGDKYALNLTSGTSATVYFQLQPDGLGSDIPIFVVVDPDNGHAETDESNNSASRFLHVITSSPCAGTEKILFAYTFGGETDLWMMNPDGSNPEPFFERAGSHESAAAISLTGDRVAFISDFSGRDELWTVDANGENPFQVTNTAALPGNVELHWATAQPWFPEDSLIAYAVRDVSGSGPIVIFGIRPDGTGNRLLMDSPNHLDYLPMVNPANGCMMAHKSDPGDWGPTSDQVISNICEGGTGILFSGSLEGTHTAWDWSNDGLWILYDVSTGSGGLCPPTNVWKIRPDGSEAVPLTSELLPNDVYLMARFSPDASRIVTLHFDGAGCFEEPSSIWIIDADGTDLHPIYTPADGIDVGWPEWGCLNMNGPPCAYSDSCLYVSPNFYPEECPWSDCNALCTFSVCEPCNYVDVWVHMASTHTTPINGDLYVQGIFIGELGWIDPGQSSTRFRVPIADPSAPLTIEVRNPHCPCGGPGCYPTGNESCFGQWSCWLAYECAEAPIDLGCFDGHHYYLSSDTREWPDARAACEAAGGYLACIGSAEENAYIYAGLEANIPTAQYVWFGFNDIASEGTWGWVNGEPVIFTNWRSGEPNNSFGDEDFGMMYVREDPSYDGQWNDVGFQNYSFPYVIEIPTGCDVCSEANGTLYSAVTLMPPTLTIQIRNGNVELNWTAVPGAEVYQVFEGGSLLATEPATLVFDTTLSMPITSGSTGNETKFFHVLALRTEEYTLDTPDGLIACWAMEEGSGDVTVDGSGNGHDGVIHAAEWTAYVGDPIDEWALGFAHTRYVQVDNDDVFYGGGYQLDAYLRVNTLPTGSPSYIITDARFATVFGGFGWRIEPTGKLFALAWDGSQWGNLQAAIPVPMNEWFHATLIINGDESLMLINGVIVAMGELPMSPSNNDMPLTIGASALPNGAHQYHLRGDIAWLKIRSLAE